MIEYPESHVLAEQLRTELVGKEIAQVEVGVSPHKFAFYFEDGAHYQALLEGQTIDDVKAYGGHVEIEAGEARIDFNDGVNFRYKRKGETLPKKHQLLISFADETHLACTVQMYGGLMAFPAGALNDNMYYKVAREKPDPLLEAFDFNYFMGIAQEAKPTLSAKGLIATEQRIPGLGNGVLQDILFNARVHPKMKIREMGEDTFERLFKSVKDTLAKMVADGGRDTEKNIYEQQGGYKSILSTKTWQAPCRVCGGEIVRQAYMGGNVYFCPTCQPLN